MTTSTLLKTFGCISTPTPSCAKPELFALDQGHRIGTWANNPRSAILPSDSDDRYFAKQGSTGLLPLDINKIHGTPYFIQG